jgi:predicted nuclease of predicted toxin-antitoxin system
MQFLANENVPGPVVRALRKDGFDVLWVREEMKAAPDHEVLTRASAEKRVVVTFDKDFGELAFRFRLPAESGIVLFRLSGGNPAVDNARVIAALRSAEGWKGQFAVVEDNRVRIRPLPSTR